MVLRANSVIESLAYVQILISRLVSKLVFHYGGGANNIGFGYM
jgi:hypothetical protein